MVKVRQEYRGSVVHTKMKSGRAIDLDNLSEDDAEKLLITNPHLFVDECAECGKSLEGGVFCEECRPEFDQPTDETETTNNNQ